MLAEQNIDGWIRLPAEFVRPPGHEHFLLRVRGNSMNRCEVAGGLIENGDLVLVRRQGEAQAGNAVVALIDGAATIKKLALAPGYAVLKPVSSETTHQPVVVKEGFRVQGVVRRVFKRGSEILARILEEGA
jgi:repressor LexA